MMKAVQVWKDGSEWWEVFDADGTYLEIVDAREDAAENGATVLIETPEPRFLVRDESGRGWATTTLYSEFTTEERGHVEDEDEPEGTFGEWLDNACLGDEFRNTDQNFTVIRVD
jgi:hypothetical protein